MRKVALFVALVVSVALPVVGQNSDIESLSGLQFTFGNPGARALGMGGAFIGLADDASAAEANPAGLTILRKAEFSIEGRNYVESQILTTSGTFPDLRSTGFKHHSDRVQVAFASAVVPIKNVVTLGLYYHEPLNNSGLGSVFDTPGGLFNEGTTVPGFFWAPNANAPLTASECGANPQCERIPLLPYATALDVRQRTWGLAVGWQIHPKFSIGATGRYQTFIADSATIRIEDAQAGDLQIAQQGTYDENLEIQEETDITFTAGFKWTIHEKFRVGGVYKKGPTFPTTYRFRSSSGAVILGSPSFHMPDIAGIGISFSPIPVLTINLDAVNVQYSNLTDDFYSPFAAVQEVGEFHVTDDITELRIGGEYFFSTRLPVAIRAGYWREPSHATTYRGPLNSPDLIGEAIIFPEREDQNHFSIGGGLAWPRFQIDAAYDTSDTYKVGSISVVTRF